MDEVISQETLRLAKWSVVLDVICLGVTWILGYPPKQMALGLLFGTILSEKAVGGVCGALLTNLSAWFSNIWFDTAMVGGAFKKVADCLPFSHAVAAVRAAAAGDYAAIMPDLWWVIGYAVVLLTAAIGVFSAKLKKY